MIENELATVDESIRIVNDKLRTFGVLSLEPEAWGGRLEHLDHQRSRFLGACCVDGTFQLAARVYAGEQAVCDPIPLGKESLENRVRALTHIPRLLDKINATAREILRERCGAIEDACRAAIIALPCPDRAESWPEKERWVKLTIAAAKQEFRRRS